MWFIIRLAARAPCLRDPVSSTLGLMSTNITPSRLRDLELFIDSLAAETDRGCALLAVALLDEELRSLIAQAFVGGEKLAKSLLSAEGPVGTFAARIDLARAIGLISAPIHRDLHLLRRIRNEFGHSYNVITFDQQTIAARCRELHHVQESVPSLPRDRFVNCFVGTLGYIHGLLQPSEKQASGKPEPVHDRPRKQGPKSRSL